MKTIRTPVAMTAWSHRMRREGVVIGFVPTMGALHAGHRSLIRAARLRCDALVVSIFVNPTQFAPTEDLATYPRRSAQDRALCREEGVDVCFEPTAAVMYPMGFQTNITVPSIARRWEGESRPHHFAGVATVVTKLFSIVRPHLALFGQKDYQQCAVVRQLVRDLNLDVRLVIRPTVRESDGLAMSSRNVFLSTEERRIAPMLFHALAAGARAVEAGITDPESVLAIVRKILGGEAAIGIEYAAVCDAETLEPLERIDRQAVILGAIRLGSVRLIDNVLAKRKAVDRDYRIRAVQKGR
jgi:pantoate--beta-alanine ligase